MLRLLGRDILNAQLRILDHRSFTNGEVNNFLNEFELKRNECEVENLFKVTEITGDLKYDLFGRCDILSTRHLGQLNREVNDVLLGVEEFLNKVQSGKKVGINITRAELLLISGKSRDFLLKIFIIKSYVFYICVLLLLTNTSDDYHDAKVAKLLDIAASSRTIQGELYKNSCDIDRDPSMLHGTIQDGNPNIAIRIDGKTGA
ncbi:biogenesis of lysosome-related organelles complex 1 subunit 5-like [Rhagoletis pomonella]|uniref:biogenesis of lysosome-related organelles complex 1 subunit 5-like n=1 Tax=Rhagoletis pomonella TaxID=28610 RepID=UPI0017863D7A|nr:biogenesis of lysosome-related organelles complex 1 subunit 5-like [Rhagoletis pomonella]